MSTNKPVLKTVDQFMEDYTPVYQPIYPLFLGKSQAWSEEVGKMEMRRVTTVGDIRTKHITPKDTEIAQVNVTESKKTFKKYFLGNQFQLSEFQNSEGVADVIAQVLDEHQKQQDDLFLLGEGTSNSTMVNNGLFHSNDSNYVLETSVEIDTDADPLLDMHSKIVTTATKANKIAGRKMIMIYGADALAKFNSLYASQPIPFKRTLSEVLGGNYSAVEMPADVTPSGTNGWIIANMDQIKLHYTVLPSLKKQGINDEKGYAWFNFLMGSMMLEVQAMNGIIRQPCTFEA